MKRTLYGICVMVLLLSIMPTSLFAQASNNEASVDDNSFIGFEGFREYIQGPDGYQLLSTAHDVLGYSAVLLGATAGLLNPEWWDIDDDIHGVIGGAATTAAVLNIGVGVLNFGNRFTVLQGESMFSLDNLHIIMGVAGGVLMLLASVTGDESDLHPYIAGTGVGLMGASILLQREW